MELAVRSDRCHVIRYPGRRPLAVKEVPDECRGPFMSRNPAEQRAPLAVRIRYRLGYLQSFGLGACLGWGIGQYLSGLSRERGKAREPLDAVDAEIPNPTVSGKDRAPSQHKLRGANRKSSPRSPSAGSLSAPEAARCLGWARKRRDVRKQPSWSLGHEVRCILFEATAAVERK